MTPAELLIDLRGRGINLVADGSRLRWKAPAGLVTAAITSQLQAHKPALLRLLAGDRRAGDDPNSEVNQRRSLYVYARRRGFPAIAPPHGLSVAAGETAWREFARSGRQTSLWEAALMLDDVPEVAA